jgi:hypothetical protein
MLRIRGAIPSLPQYIFMAWYFIKHREKFTFTRNITQQFYVQNHNYVILFVVKFQDSLQIRRVATDIVNKQLRQPTMGGPPAWGFSEGLTAHRKRKTASYKMLHNASNLDGGTNDGFISS